MTVILLHPDDELKIINFQNELIQKLYDNNNYIFYKTFPLWIPLTNLNDKNNSFSKTLLKETGKIIKQVKLSRIYCENNNIIMEVTILAEKENKQIEFTENLVILTGTKKNKCEDEEDSKINFFIKNDFPGKYDKNSLEEKQLKIFRIGNVNALSGNSASISDSVWCKIK